MRAISPQRFFDACQKQQSQGIAVYHLDNLPDADPDEARDLTETLWIENESSQRILDVVPVGATVRLIEVARASGVRSSVVNSRLSGSTRFMKVSRGYYRRLY